MKRVSCQIIFFITFLLILSTLSLAAQHKVIRVVDGDTIVVDYKGKYEKVRLLCVNTPESVHPDKKQNTFMGKVASDYTQEMLEGKHIDLEFEGPRRGNYGRLLAYVFVDGKNFNLELVETGLSPYYTKYGLSQKYDKEFRDAERYARDHKLNIWENYELTQKYLRLKSKWGQQKTQVRAPPAITQPSDWNYVASRNSKVFHRPDCVYVKRILLKNLIRFSTREEAISSGRRPCKVCKP